jgi:PPOX class probable F420-dependent enzyme
MNSLDQFAKKKYLNLETFRRSGESMKTPVWFVQDGEILYVHTVANSGKVKRIRNNGRVNIAPCKMDGKLVGAWVPAQAREVTAPEISTLVDRLLDKKYGLLKKMFESQNARTGVKSTTLEIRISE